MRRTKLGMLLGVAVLLVAGCAPGPGAAAVDTIDLGPLGVFAEPGLTITASTAESYSPRGPRSTTLTVIARDADGAIVRLFTMSEENVSGPITPPVVGDFPGLVESPHFRRFVLAGGADDPLSTTYLGSLTITELEEGELVGNTNGWSHEVTRLRASFRAVFDDYGVVDGYLTIG